MKQTLEQAIAKLKTLLERTDKEVLEELIENINKAFSNPANQELKMKSAYSIGVESDPGNYISIDFRITENLPEQSHPEV